ncbi:MAG: IclR family transcriptional regulator [Chloroflexota bacterium]
MSESIRAVERALDVLLCFTSNTPELSMTQISELVGINKSTVHRLLATLERKRFVERDETTGVYRPGIRLLQMAYLTMDHNNLRRLAAPFLHSLCNQYRENVNLSVLEDVSVIYVDVVESPQRVKLAATVGQQLPAFCTASGKAMLAFLPEDHIQRILEHGLPRYTRNTILTKEAFLENLRIAQAQGFALSEQEFEEGINAIAAPVLNSDNRPVASISIAGPAYRLTRERMLEIGPDFVAQIRKFAEEVELVVSLDS